MFVQHMGLLQNNCVRELAFCGGPWKRERKAHLVLPLMNSKRERLHHLLLCLMNMGTLGFSWKLISVLWPLW